MFLNLFLLTNCKTCGLLTNCKSVPFNKKIRFIRNANVRKHSAFGKRTFINNKCLKYRRNWSYLRLFCFYIKSRQKIDYNKQYLIKTQITE